MPNYSTDSKLKNKMLWLRAIGWLMVLLVFVMSLISLPQTNSPISNSDKWLHLLTYFILSYWFFHVYIKQTKYIVIGFLALGVTLELLQNLTPQRYFEWLDMLMNVTGMAFALLTFRVFKLRIKYIAG